MPLARKRDDPGQALRAEDSPRNAAYWWVWLGSLPRRILEAAAWWSLIMLVMSVIDPGIVLAEPAARLRWVAVASVITAVVGGIPVRGWRRT
jgi:hypothetical protein